MRGLDDALGLSGLALAALRDSRPGKNTVHRRDGLFRQSVYGRLAGYKDVSDADRPALDPVMRQVVGGRAVDAQAASAPQMGRFETETLALSENREALADLNGQWKDRFHNRKGLNYITLDMDSSVSPTLGDQEGASSDKEAPGHRQVRMASGRGVPKCRLHRHQPAYGPGSGGAVLQSARHGRAAHQGGHVCLPPDAAVLQAVPRQRGAVAAARAGIQSGHLASCCIELPEAARHLGNSVDGEIARLIRGPGQRQPAETFAMLPCPFPATDTSSPFSSMRSSHPCLRVPDYDAALDRYVRSFDFRVVKE